MGGNTAARRHVVLQEVDDGYKKPRSEEHGAHGSQDVGRYPRALPPAVEVSQHRPDERRAIRCVVTAGSLPKALAATKGVDCTYAGTKRNVKSLL